MDSTDTSPHLWPAFLDFGETPYGRLVLAALFVSMGLLAAVTFPPVGAGGPGGAVHFFLYRPSERYSDLIVSVLQTRGGDPYGSGALGPVTYFPFAYCFLAVARRWTPKAAVGWFLTLSVAGYLVACFWATAEVFGRSFRRFRAALLLSTLALASYPLIFALDRGNLDALIGMLCFLSLLLCEERPYVSALFLAVAIAFKGYPGILCVVFYIKGHTKAGLWAAAAAGLLSLLGLLTFSGGFTHNVLGFCVGMREYRRLIVDGWDGLHYSADPYNALKILGHGLKYQYPKIALWCLGWAKDHYGLFSGTVLLASTTYAAFARTPFHRKLLAVTLGMILFPDLANDYKLVHLIPVIFFMVVSEDPWENGDAISFVVLLLLLIPKNYLFLYGDVSASCIVSPFLMLVLLARLALDRKAWTTVGLAICESGFFRKVCW